jgi:hypothetical protein
LSKEQSQRLATILWSLWKHRNLKVWEDVTETCAVVVERARVLLEDWQLANGLRTLDQPVLQGVQQASATGTAAVHTPSVAAIRDQLSWKPPAQGRFKCNIDATFSSSHNRTGIGICIRDEEGIFVLAKTVRFARVYDVEVGEALGLFHAIQWTSDTRMENIDFEVDSKVTKDAFSHRREDISEFGNIVSASRSLFNSKFSNSRVEFVRRQANAVAHNLAREVTLLASPVTYYAIPNCIESLIINEML